MSEEVSTVENHVVVTQENIPDVLPKVKRPRTPKLVLTEEEKTFIKDNALVLHDEQAKAAFVAKFGRQIAIGQYRDERKALGIKKAPGRGPCKLARPKDVPSAQSQTVL